MINYPTDVTDEQYNAIRGVLNDKRKRNHSLREIFNAILYMLKTGCHWRMLQGDFPKWELVYYYFSKCSKDVFLFEINDELRNMLRSERGNNKSSSIGLIDSQSVKTIRFRMGRARSRRWKEDQGAQTAYIYGHNWISSDGTSSCGKYSRHLLV